MRQLFRLTRPTPFTMRISPRPSGVYHALSWWRLCVVVARAYRHQAGLSAGHHNTQILALTARVTTCLFIQLALEFARLGSVIRLDPLQVVYGVMPRLLISLQRLDGLQANTGNQPYPVVNGVAG